MIYGVCFSLSVLFAFIVTKTKGLLCYLSAFFAILFPSALFGIRDNTLGCDVLLYVDPIWDYALSLKYFDFSAIYWGNTIEIGYLFLNFVLTRFFDDVHWFYFIASFLSCCFVFLGLYRKKLQFPIWLGFASYLLIFFPRSINIVRQSFSLAIILFAYDYALKKQWLKYIFWVFVASLFHKSSFVAILIPVIISVIGDSKNQVRLILPIVVGALLLLFFERYYNYLLFFVDDKYSIYFDGTFKPHFTLFSLFNIPFIIFFFFFYKKMRIEYPEVSLLLVLLCLGFLWDQLSWVVSVYLARLSAVFNLAYIYSSMILVAWFSRHFSRRVTFVVRWGVLFYNVLYFILCFIVAGQSGIYPYSSEIIDRISF